MKHFIIEVLDTAEQITPEKAFDILTFTFRGEVLNVSDFRPTMRALDFAICAPEYHASLDEAGDRFCRMCGQPLSQ